MGTSGTHEWHHPAFTINEEALPISAEYFALLAERALNNSHKKPFKVHLSTLNGFSY